MDSILSNPVWAQYGALGLTSGILLLTFVRLIKWFQTSNKELQQAHQAERAEWRAQAERLYNSHTAAHMETTKRYDTLAKETNDVLREFTKTIQTVNNKRTVLLRRAEK